MDLILLALATLPFAELLLGLILLVRPSGERHRALLSPVAYLVAALALANVGQGAVVLGAAAGGLASLIQILFRLLREALDVRAATANSRHRL